MILKLIIALLVVTVGITSIGHDDVFGQTLQIGESPYAREYIGTEFLDAYFGMMGEKIEVSPGDQNVPLTVVFTNVGSHDIIGLKSQLSLPFGFSDARDNDMLAKADSEVNALTGDIFSMTFYVNIADNAQIGTYPASVKLDYSRLRESGGRSDFFEFDFQLTGRSVINMKAQDQVLTSIKSNHVVMQLTNDGTVPISGVILRLNNGVSEIASTSQSITNIENVVVSGSQWDVGDVAPGETTNIELDILVPDTLKSETLRLPMDITYFNAHGEQTATTRMVDFYVNGLIDISANNIKIKEISEKRYILGDIVNEGNEDGLFGYATIKPLNDSTLKPVTSFIDEIEVDSPVPFNIPVEFDGEPSYGNNDLEITIRYKDTLRNEHFVTQQATVFIDEPKETEESNNPSLEFILPVIVLIVVIVAVLGKKGYIPLGKKVSK